MTDHDVPVGRGRRKERLQDRVSLVVPADGHQDVGAFQMRGGIVRARVGEQSGKLGDGVGIGPFRRATQAFQEFIGRMMGGARWPVPIEKVSRRRTLHDLAPCPGTAGDGSALGETDPDVCAMRMNEGCACRVGLREGNFSQSNSGRR